MGIFYSKLLESVDDAVQTPDDIGVDLDAIEDAIVGKDGIEAHRDEIEDAAEGVVGDPLEEAAVIMYESEYNFNQLLKCIGIAELNEMSAGRDFVLEAGSANSESFWDKAREVFARMFAAITKEFSNVVNAIKAKMPTYSKFVKKNEAVIRQGASKIDGTFKNCYDFKKLNQPYNGKDNTLSDKFEDAVTDPNWNADSDSSINHENIIKSVAPDGITASDKNEFSKKIQEYYFVKTDYTASAAVDEAIDILKQDTGLKGLYSAYATIKEQYSRLFKNIKKAKKSFNSKKNASDATSTSACVAYMNACRFEKNIQHTYFATVLRAHKLARSQAHRIALKCYTAGSKKTKEADAEVQHNSAFINIDII